ncbi:MULTISPECIES: CgeB family protein [Bacillus cereus group]|uniref:Glycosyltransferase n=1 Tax=Bacillus cereus TaxID=1396 RepID=A0A9W7QB07_BACCE|nr:glycosyltransferase [Bacillus cereus]KAB2388950.1 glycosyltransferase [Bacillus cereus]KAB2406383.1 glycosyltransferase [Bacillus cereus]KAB2427404.1 glycosyltransferase [Bacillus cereus]
MGILNKNILFVQSGIPFYYPSLEMSIYNALKKAVQTVTIVSTSKEAIKTAIKTKPDFNHVIPLLKDYGFKTGLWLTDDPYYSDLTQHIVSQYDYVFTQNSGIIDFYKKIGCNHVFYIPLASDPSIYKPAHNNVSYLYDITFLGTAFENRLSFIDSIADYLKQKNTCIVGYGWEKLRHYELLKDKIKLKILGTYEESLQYYTSTKININMHRTTQDQTLNCNSLQIEAHSINNRTFEIANSCAFQLTDVRSNLMKHYTLGSEIETFHSSTEFITKAEYYLAHEKERLQIATNAYKRTLREHTYNHRIRQLLDHINI